MLVHHLHLRDEDKIILCITETLARPSGFDAVAVSPRNDYGFGYSQIDRFVKNSKSEELLNICNMSRENRVLSVLPAKFSNSKVILAPTIKKNDELSRADATTTMLELLNLCTSFETAVDSLLITHFRFIRSYKENHFLGILDAIKIFSDKSSKIPKSITIELRKDYFDKAEANIKSVFNSKPVNLEEFFIYAISANWCVSSFCTTCGNKDFRSALSKFNRNELIKQATEISKNFIDDARNRQIILCFLYYISDNQLIFLPDFGNSPLQDFIDRANSINSSRRAEGRAKIKADQEARVEKQRINDEKNIWNALRRNDFKAIKVFLDRGLNLQLINSEGLTVNSILKEMDFYTVIEKNEKTS